MAKSVRSKKFARQLSAMCIEEDQVVPERVSAVLQALDKKPPREYKTVLRAFRNYLREEVAMREAVVEHAGPLEEAAQKQLADFFRQTYGRSITIVPKENKELLAGFRARVGCDTYEYSARQQLEKLSRQVAAQTI
ncbi:MAG: F0F1 ATP synthase subunit delta [Opitutales bacterium]|nr:F0F1 ATP synthase subunit delta [Opitutales bacterium]